MFSSILMIVATVAVVWLCIAVVKLEIRLFRWFFGYKDGEKMPFLMKLLLFDWLFGSHNSSDSD